MKAKAWKAVIVIGSLVSTALFASAFYLVIVRSDISEDAGRVAVLEYKILNAHDLLRGLEVAVDDSVQPHVLKSRIDGYLELPFEGQVVRVDKASVDGFDSERLVVGRAVLDGKEGV